MMADVVRELQSVVDLPLQIDTSSISAMERAMRLYNGKPLVNSVNGKREGIFLRSIEIDVSPTVFILRRQNQKAVIDRHHGLRKHYGGVVVAL